MKCLLLLKNDETRERNFSNPNSVQKNLNSGKFSLFTQFNMEIFGYKQTIVGDVIEWNVYKTWLYHETKEWNSKDLNSGQFYHNKREYINMTWIQVFGISFFCHNDFYMQTNISFYYHIIGCLISFRDKLIIHTISRTFWLFSMWVCQGLTRGDFFGDGGKGKASLWGPGGG